jgi:hypothetical protein
MAGWWTQGQPGNAMLDGSLDDEEGKGEIGCNSEQRAVPWGRLKSGSCNAGRQFGLC